MNLKNYTSEISADITIARIERILIGAGVDGIQKLYERGQLASLIFKIQFEPDKPPVTVRNKWVWVWSPELLVVKG